MFLFLRTLLFSPDIYLSDMSNVALPTSANDAQPVLVYELRLEEDGGPNKDRAVSISIRPLSALGADVDINRYSIHGSLHPTLLISLE